MKTCTEFEMEIMDAFYGEGIVSEDCKSHLATCKACQTFYASLSDLPKRPEKEIAVDEWVIGEAVKAAMEITEKKNAFERRLFLIASLAVTGVGLALVFSGFGSLLRSLYVGIYLGGPFLLPIIIWKRQKGGREHA